MATKSKKNEILPAFDLSDIDGQIKELQQAIEAKEQEIKGLQNEHLDLEVNRGSFEQLKRLDDQIAGQQRNLEIMQQDLRQLYSDRENAIFNAELAIKEAATEAGRAVSGDVFEAFEKLDRAAVRYKRIKDELKKKVNFPAPSPNTEKPEDWAGPDLSAALDLIKKTPAISSYLYKLEGFADPKLQERRRSEYLERRKREKELNQKTPQKSLGLGDVVERKNRRLTG